VTKQGVIKEKQALNNILRPARQKWRNWQINAP